MIPSRLVWDLDRKNAVTVCFAAGNSNLDCDGLSSILCINSNEGGITAAALDHNGSPQDYSARGPGQCSHWHPFIGAPTFGVLPYGRGFRDFGFRGGGTSSAAPQVSGALALLKGEMPAADNTELRTALAAGALQFGPTGFDPGTGFGMLQVDRALEAVPTAMQHPLARVIGGLTALTPPSLAASRG